MAHLNSVACDNIFEKLKKDLNFEKASNICLIFFREKII